MEISKFVSPEIIFGKGSLSQVGECAQRVGATKVFVVGDEGVLAAGWISRALQYLEESHLPYEVWTRISPNPRDVEIEEGRRVYVESGCDAVLAIGGGSVIDAAKAVALVASNPSPIADYEGVDNIKRPLPPIITVPSTAGSGSEVSQFCIIKDSARRLKMTIVSKSLVPDICVADPLLLTTVGSELTAFTGMEVLTHAIEAYVSVASTSFTDVHALEAIRLVARNLPASVSSQANLEAKTKMAMASIHAGLALSNAILGLMHAITHQLSGLLDMHQGKANAILLPYVMRFNMISSIDKYARIAEAMGIDVERRSTRDAAEAAVFAIERLARDIGIPRHLADENLKENIIPQLAVNAAKDVCIVTNPRDVTVEDIEAILRAACDSQPQSHT